MMVSVSVSMTATCLNTSNKRCEARIFLLGEIIWEPRPEQTPGSRDHYKIEERNDSRSGDQ